VEAGRGSRSGSMAGAAPFQTVWQGSSWSRFWSWSRSPAKQGLDIDDCGDELLDTKAMRQDVKALYRR